MVMRYARGSNDWVVVKIYIPGVIAENAYTTELSEDGKNLFFKRAVPAYFLENKRLNPLSLPDVLYVDNLAVFSR